MLPSLVQLLTDDSAACKVFARLADCRRAWYASFCCAESRYAQVSTQVSTCVAASAMEARGIWRDGGRSALFTYKKVHAHGTLAPHVHTRHTRTCIQQIDVMIGVHGATR